VTWDARGYFYRCRRVKGQPRREYVGHGLMGRLGELEAEEERCARIQLRAQERVQRDRVAAIDVPLGEWCAVAEVLARLALVDAGYRQHDRGHWRRSRTTDAEDR
jgi:hypothetical protein